MRPVDVQIITYAPTVFYHCQHCEITFGNTSIGERVHREQSQSALPDDLRDSYEQIVAWVDDLWQRHGNRVSVKVVDAASLEGVWKSLRFKVRRYPAVIVEGERKQLGSEFHSLDQMIDRSVASVAGGGGIG